MCGASQANVMEPCESSRKKPPNASAQSSATASPLSMIRRGSPLRGAQYFGRHAARQARNIARRAYVDDGVAARLAPRPVGQLASLSAPCSLGAGK